ncbi:MAG: NAD-dependent protein deacetylase [Lentisphaerae bacterium ADurb.Bin242]|nr:MAG: NAD-dependent protein deacetylase [Lentisphaerae bacterium ADurb.Bin242]
MDLPEKIRKAASVVRANPGRGIAFTGAGVSVESGIPPFRGRHGLWNTVDPSFIELNHFYADPEGCWTKIREVFYDHWGKAEPNEAHFALAELMKEGFLEGIVTQNIDALHQRAGAENVIEFHGTMDELLCLQCSARHAPERELLDQKRPTCPKCGGLLKPDFVFFSEGIPKEAFDSSFQMAEDCAFILVIGTSGEVMPACEIPRIAKRHGAVLIEVNPEPSAFTRTLTDIFLPGPATEIMRRILREVEAS